MSSDALRSGNTPKLQIMRMSGLIETQETGKSLPGKEMLIETEQRKFTQSRSKANSLYDSSRVRQASQNTNGQAAIMDGHQADFGKGIRHVANDVQRSFAESTQQNQDEILYDEE